ncbi:hypothetical protein D9M68_858530 [compost metagenome]
MSKLDDWHECPLQSKGDLKDLVITYSNVNDSVLTVNAEAIGLNEMPSYGDLDLSKLGALVGIRNSIGHGAMLNPPGVRELDELVVYTESLIRQYADVVLEWIKKHEDLHRVKRAWWV